MTILGDGDADDDDGSVIPSLFPYVQIRATAADGDEATAEIRLVALWAE